MYPYPVIFNDDWLELWVVWVILIGGLPVWYYIWLYLDAVMPSDYGVQKHPCFCCMRAGDHREILPDDEESALLNRVKHDDIYDERDPIRLDMLTKKFGSMKAVDNLEFSIRKGEIFTILGHNGAGKTTAINMLTGMLKPTRGDAWIYGDRISDQMDAVQ